MNRGFSIVVPAFNEEQAIAAILKRCLEARGPLREATGLEVQIICVDDGSKDRTKELAAAFPEVKLLSHARNKGYGRALMTGFSAASGDYLGFLDADGTCDPLAFAELWKALKENDADMAVGNRLHGESRMPRIRELGNRFFAWVITWLSGVPVADSASGMRILKKALLARMAPLPAGLHFTPALTAQAACLGARIVEAPIPYDHRQGESKLRVASDGLRFLRVILGTIFAYFPLRIFGPLGAVCVVAALAYGWPPVLYYARHARLEEYMIYRLLTVTAFSVCGLTFWAFGLLAQRAADALVRRPPGVLDAPWLRAAACACGGVLGAAGVLLNSKTILEYFSRGTITIHWVYVLTGALLVISGTVLVSFGITLGVVANLPRALKVFE